jgi:hypothetical protein
MVSAIVCVAGIVDPVLTILCSDPASAHLRDLGQQAFGVDLSAHVLGRSLGAERLYD